MSGLKKMGNIYMIMT